MAGITIYTTAFCPYCHAAKALLQRKGAAYDEIDVSYDPAGRQRMAARSNGQRAVPQIFIGEAHVGGYDELHALDRQGRLDPMLAGA
ncbi:MAG: glutaredoxin 3 [Hyphomicrobiales bacterium]